MQDPLRNQIPSDLEAAFKEGRSVKRWIAAMKGNLQGLEQIRKYFKQESIGFEDVANGINLILDRVALNVPYAVCVGCERHLSCHCRGRGWLTSAEYKCRPRSRSGRHKRPTSERDTLRMELDAALSGSSAPTASTS